MAAAALRCRLRLHRWARFREPPGHDGVWVTRCRLCGAAQGPAGPIAIGVFVIFLVVGVSAFWWAPFLGAILVMGAMAGIGYAMGPPILERMVRWFAR